MVVRSFHGACARGLAAVCVATAGAGHAVHCISADAHPGAWFACSVVMKDRILD